MKDVANNYTRRVNITLLTLFVVAMGIFFIVTPKYNDDIWHLKGWGEWFERNGAEIPSDGVNVFTAKIPADKVWESIKVHLDKDRVRLSNAIGFLFLLPPKWIGSTIAFLFWLVTVWCVFKLSFTRYDDTLLLALAMAMWVFIFPWYEYMGCIMLQFNYLVPSGLMIMLLVWLRHGGRTGWSAAFLAAYTFIAGLFHEGFTVSVLGSLIIIGIFYKECRTRRIWLVVGALALALAIQLHPGGPIYKMTTDAGLGSTMRMYLMRTLTHVPSIWIALCVSAAYIWRKGFRRFVSNPFYCFCWVSEFLGIILAMMAREPRGAWWGDVCVLMMILHMARQVVHLKAVWRYVLAALLLVPTFFELIMLDIYTFRFASEYRRIYRQYRIKPGEPYFTSLIASPWESWYMAPTVSQNWTFYYMRTPELYGLPWSGNEMKIIPDDLRRVNEHSGSLLQGDMGIRKVGRHLVAPAGAETPVVQNVTADFGVRHFEGLVFCIPFKSESDGKIYYYIDFPWREFEKNLFDIKGVWLK